MPRLAQALAVTGGFAVLALVGCNAVLGIDEAHSRDEGFTSGKGQEVPSDKCNGPQPVACATCITTNCPGARDDCLASHDCREALDTYRKCLGSSCDDASCLAALQAGPARALAGCALSTTECPECPQATPLVDVCELYCACMQQPMPESAGAPYVGQTCEQYNGTSLKEWAAGDREACKTACRGLNDPAAAHCRWTHCELSQSTEKAFHCGHAIGDSRCPLAVNLDAGCKDRRITGWGCDRSEQCCSDTCSGHICSQ
jgi:hypothetical protein